MQVCEQTIMINWNFEAELKCMYSKSLNEREHTAPPELKRNIKAKLIFAPLNYNIQSANCLYHKIHDNTINNTIYDDNTL